VGLAGIMGGGNSEVQDGTTRVFLECAEFDPVAIRRAATAHQKRTEASHRFERGVDPEGTEAAARRFAQYVLELAGGRVVGAVASRLESREPRTLAARRPGTHCSPEWINGFLGTSWDETEIAGALRQVGCRIEKSGEGASRWTVVAPSHRLDISLREDLAEEVARIVGYDRIPATVPPLTTLPAASVAGAGVQRVLWNAKQALAQAGLVETLNLGFTSGAWLGQFGLQGSARVLNPLSEEHEVLVPSLLPGLVRQVQANWRHHFGSELPAIRLFEVRPTFHARGEIRAESEMQTNVEESWKLAFVLTGPRFASGLRGELGEVDFFDAKAVLEQLWESLGTRGLRLQPQVQSAGAAASGQLAQKPADPVAGIFHPGQSAEIIAGNRCAGFIGALHPRLALELKTRAPIWLCELDWEQLTRFSRKPEDSPRFQGWSEFPPMERDFALLVDDGIPADRIVQLALRTGKPLVRSARVFDVYRGSQVGEGKRSVGVRVVLANDARSLLEAEAEECSRKLVDAWKRELQAEIR
jgi:phenylalanyl-tRNA synthetase beta chain